MRKYWKIFCDLTLRAVPVKTECFQDVVENATCCELHGMSPIKAFYLNYEALNEEDTFSEGDALTGTVTLVLKKEIKVKSLFVKAKSDARVKWTDDDTSYSAERRYFKLKEYLVAENAQGTVLSQGVHHFKFGFTIPQRDMPSSFTGHHGSIVYMLEAKMCRSWQWPSEVRKEIKFVSTFLRHPGQCPQSGSVTKQMGILSKGQVQMFATVNKKVCSPGDTLSVAVKVQNTSSKKMRPKFSLQQETVYRASLSQKTCGQTLYKMTGGTIEPNSEQTVSCQVKIPTDAIYTLENCELISVDYVLKVYLDISFTFDPEVLFPLVIIPSSFTNLQYGEAVGPHPFGAVGGPSYGDFPPPAFPV